MSLQNPYNQVIHPNFGKGDFLPPAINNRYETMKGNPALALSQQIAYEPVARYPNSLTKDGESKNKIPRGLPTNNLGIKYPQRSTSSDALIETDRVGLQLGASDVYRDNPYSDWTYGIQYYTAFQGTNPKTSVIPVLYPQAWRKETWAQDSVDYTEINREATQDITDLSMEYTCKGCDIASASLGSPVFYQPRNPTAPLPVQWPGETSINGGYSARLLGENSRNFPPPVQAIVELQRRKAGYQPTYIPKDYDNYTLNNLRQGFVFD